MKIKKLFLITFLTFYHSVICANTIDLAINQVSGTSTYEVKAKPLGLKSRLHFPYDFYVLNISFYDDFLNGDIKIGASFPLTNQRKVSQDYDWKNDQLTVFSTSNSHLDKFYAVHVEWETELINRFDLVSKILLQELDTTWSNTKQYDYVKDFESVSLGNTLEFEQNYFLFDVGINYLAWKTKKTKFLVEAKYINGLVKFKDTHLLRDFYTLQDSKVHGHSLELKLGYSLGSAGNLSFGFLKKNLHDRKALMDYFSTSGSKFASYPSNYQDKRNVYKITFQKDF